MGYTVENLSKYLVEQGSTQSNADKTVTAIDTVLTCPYANEILYVNLDFISAKSPFLAIVVKDNTAHDVDLVRLTSELSYNSSLHLIPDNSSYDSAFEFSVISSLSYMDNDEPHGFTIWKA